MSALLRNTKEVSERYEFMKTQIDDVESSRAELLTLIGDLTGKMSERFREQFDRINTYLRSDILGAVRRRQGGTYS